MRCLVVEWRSYNISRTLVCLLKLCYYTGQNRYDDPAVTVLTCIREVLCSIHGQITASLFGLRIFAVFLNFYRRMPGLDHNYITRLPPKSFPTHYSQAIVPLHTMQSEILIAVN